MPAAPIGRHRSDSPRPGKLVWSLGVVMDGASALKFQSKIVGGTSSGYPVAPLARVNSSTASRRAYATGDTRVSCTTLNRFWVAAEISLDAKSK